MYIKCLVTINEGCPHHFFLFWLSGLIFYLSSEIYELAVKFYLAIKRDDGWKCPGPNARDNWQAKLDRMRDHQFQLTRRAEARALLKDKFGITDITVQHLIYGCLFLPIGCDEWPAPDAISGNARIGRWLYVSQWEPIGVRQMLALVSPAKKLDFDSEWSAPAHTQPAFLEDAQALVAVLKDMPQSTIQSLMHLSDKLGKIISVFSLGYMGCFVRLI